MFGLGYEPTRSLFLLLTPFYLLFAAILVLNTEFISKNISYWLWLVPMLIGTFVIEAIGVRDGNIFGEYVYGNVLGYKLFEVPIIIPINWVMVIWGAYTFSSLLTKDKFAKAFITAACAVVFDFVMEPIAITLGFWTWANVSVPLENYLMWFVISLVGGFAAHYLKLKANTNIVLFNLVLQFLFFLCLLLLI
jgi:putative membrane protein